MWTTLALAALSFAPGQADQLSLLNVRSVAGYFGPERQTDKLLPGDVYLLVFDIDGFKIDATAENRIADEIEMSEFRSPE